MEAELLEIWWEVFEAFGRYTKILEYGIIFATIGLGIFAARKLHAGARQMREELKHAVVTLKAQTQEIGDMREVWDGVAARFKAQLQEMIGELEASGMGAARERRAVDEGEAQAVDASGRQEAEDDAAVEAERQAQHRVHDEWWQPVVRMKFSDPDPERPLRLHWKNNVRVRLPWAGTWLTGWRNDSPNSPNGVCGVGLSGERKSLDALWQRMRRQLVFRR